MARPVVEVLRGVALRMVAVALRGVAVVARLDVMAVRSWGWQAAMAELLSGWRLGSVLLSPALMVVKSRRRPALTTARWP